MAVLAVEDEEQVDPFTATDPFAAPSEDEAPVIDTSGETEDAAASDAGTEEAESVPDGISDEWRELAKDYHLDDSTIDKFGTSDELMAHLRVLDQMRQPQVQAPPAQEPVVAPPKSDALNALDLELDDLDADDPTRKALEKVRAFLVTKEQEHQQSEAKRLEQQEQQFAQHLSSELDKALDDYSSPKFGKTGELIGAQWRNRERVYKAYEWAVVDSLRNGKQPDYKQLAQTAANVLFPKQFEQQVTQKTTEAVLKRSKQRTGAGSRGPRQESTVPYAESPAFDDAWKRLMRGE